MRKQRGNGKRTTGRTMKALCALLILCGLCAALLFGCGGDRADSSQPVSADQGHVDTVSGGETTEKPSETETPTAHSPKPSADPATPVPTLVPIQGPTAVPTEIPLPQIPEGSAFEIWFLDVGQGDAACVLCDGEAMLIDGGDRGNSSLMYSFLESHGITHLNSIVATHADADHIGGLSGALQYADAETVYCTQTEGDTKVFENFDKQLQKRGASITIPHAGEQFMLGSASVTFLYPDDGVRLGDNTSLVVRICYGETSFLFMGDCEIDDETRLLASGADLESDVLKVAHHGSSNSTGETFLDRVDPVFAVISVGRDNAYGHPTKEVLSLLKERGVALFRTDLFGTVHCTSDGTNIVFDTEKNNGADPYASAEAVDRTIPTEEPAVRITYVANKNTKKFHRPDCSSVKDIKESNRWDFTGTREELIEMGYVPCKRCNP